MYENQLLINYYKKEEMKKVKEMAKERKRLKEILKNVNMKYISKDEILELLGEDYDEEIEKYQKQGETINNTENTYSKNTNTPMEMARRYKIFYENSNKNREEVCRKENISNGILQRYLRLNYLIPELQVLVDNRKLCIKAGEQISYLDTENQKMIENIITIYDYDISNSLAKKIKEEYKNCERKGKDFIINKEILDKFKTQRWKEIKISFTEDEIEKYFKYINHKQIKEYIISVLENMLRKWGIFYGQY